MQRLVIYVALGITVVALVAALRYGIAANRLRDPTRIRNRFFAFLPPRMPDEFVGLGWRLHVRQTWAIIVAVLALFLGALISRWLA